ncbi:MAG TPA: hypothetical protein VH280_00290 [Verrucomicrobiae bacterium]|jgi:hypothetical protein|nr:hypothetical protein [Verrucomicrobiae bacterium]
MNDEHSEDWPKTQPDFALIPPWPPKQTTQDLGDDGKNFLIRVSFTENHRLPDKSKPSKPLAEFTFDSSHRKQETFEVTSHDGSSLSGFAAYSPNGYGNRGLLSVLIRRDEAVLTTVSCLGSYNVHSTAWLSPENTIVISVSQRRK